MIRKRRESLRTRKPPEKGGNGDKSDVEDGGEIKKRTRASKWTQEETEKLVSLLLEYSKDDLLNKETNAIKKPVGSNCTASSIRQNW